MDLTSTRRVGAISHFAPQVFKHQEHRLLINQKKDRSDPEEESSVLAIVLRAIALSDEA